MTTHAVVLPMFSVAAHQPCINCGGFVKDKRANVCRRCAGTSNRSHVRSLPSRVRRFTALEGAWLGALFEGEGSLAMRGSRGGRRPGELLVSIGSTSVETIATVLRLVGAGYVGLGIDKPGRKPMWYWHLRRRVEQLDFLDQVRWFLTEKRERLQSLFLIKASERPGWDEVIL